MMEMAPEDAAIKCAAAAELERKPGLMHTAAR
jgi:hypothetical protein